MREFKVSDFEGAQTEPKKAGPGRKPVATEDLARKTVEEFRREGRVITTAGIKEVIGGATGTVERLLQKIGALPDRIDVTSPLPIALSKIFLQCVQEHTLSVRAECQKEIDTIRELLDQVLSLLLDSDKANKEKDAELGELRTERDSLRGETTVMSVALQKANELIEALRHEAKTASTAEGVMAVQLETALSAAQHAEAQLGEERRRHAASRNELAHSLETVSTVNNQAEEHLRELERLGGAWEIERRLHAEYTQKLHAILEFVAKKDAGVQQLLGDIKSPSAPRAEHVESPHAELAQARARRPLDIEMLRRAQKGLDEERPDQGDSMPV